MRQLSANTVAENCQKKMNKGMGMRKLILAVVTVACLGLAGCAIMPPDAKYTYEKNPPIVAADDSSGVVYFIRESAFVGGGAGYYIVEDDKKIGLLASGSYFMHKTTPGKHAYWAEGDDARSAIILDIHPGNTYYITTWVSTDVVLIFVTDARFHLKEVPRPVAEKLLPGLKYLHLATVEK